MFWLGLEVTRLDGSIERKWCACPGKPVRGRAPRHLVIPSGLPVMYVGDSMRAVGVLDPHEQIEWSLSATDE